MRPCRQQFSFTTKKPGALHTPMPAPWCCWVNAPARSVWQRLLQRCKVTLHLEADVRKTRLAAGRCARESNLLQGLLAWGSLSVSFTQARHLVTGR